MSSLNDQIRQIENVFDTLDFKNFYKYVYNRRLAIYNDGYLYLSDKTVKFDENIRNSIKDYSNYIVLNYESLSNDVNINVGYYLYKLIINIFYENHDRRIPNDLVAVQYPRIFLNYDYMSYERKLILKAINSKDNYVKLNYFRMFLNVRDLRRQIVGNEFSMLEYGHETIEGLALYALYSVVKYLNNTTGKELFKKILTDFNTLHNEYFDLRNSNRSVGLLMLLILEDLQIDIHKLYENDNTIYQLATSKIRFFSEPIAYQTDKNLLTTINKFEEDVAEKFALFFENNPVRVTGSYQIFGYDPYRIFTDKDNLYHESFVVLKNLLDNELIRIEGPVITKVMENSIDIVTSYHYLDKETQNFKKIKQD